MSKWFNMKMMFVWPLTWWQRRKRIHDFRSSNQQWNNNNKYAARNVNVFWQKFPFILYGQHTHIYWRIQSTLIFDIRFVYFLCEIALEYCVPIYWWNLQFFHFPVCMSRPIWNGNLSLSRCAMTLYSIDSFGHIFFSVGIFLCFHRRNQRCRL